MARVALRTLFGTAFPKTAGIGRIFWDIRNEFQDFKLEKALIFDKFYFARFRKYSQSRDESMHNLDTLLNDLVILDLIPTSAKVFRLR